MTLLITIQIATFVLGSTVFLIYSLRYLTNPRVHGFYRFFGWELTLLLLVVNLPVWFNEPYSAYQMASWGLLLLSLLIAVASFVQLVSRGKPAGGSFEDTTRIVDNGMYRFIRHPLYGSLILFTWGVALKRPDLLSLVAGLAATLFYYLTARVEEEEILAKFGESYREYMKKTKMFLPFVF